MYSCDLHRVRTCLFFFLYLLVPKIDNSQSSTTDVVYRYSSRGCYGNAMHTT